MTAFPRTLGKDFAGIVEEGPEGWKGKNVIGTSGNSFIVDGAQAEYAVGPVGAVAPKPEYFTFAQAASLGTLWMTAAWTLARAHATPEDTVMVLGATGSVGSAVMQIAALKGCKTLGVGRHGTDINSVPDPELKAAKDLTHGRGPDIVVDTVGDFALTYAAINILAVGGRLITITAPRSGSTQSSVDILNLYRKQISLIRCNTALPSQETVGEVLRELVSGFEDGKLNVPDEKEFTLLPLDRAMEAYDGRAKKAIIVMD